VIPLLSELALMSSGRTLFVEQPELHLHPRQQAQLADVLIEATFPGFGPPDRQVIVETHSEPLIRRLQRHIRDGDVAAKEVAVLYVRRSDQGSRAERVVVDDDGSFLSLWPGGFFDERVDDLFATLDIA